MKKAEAKKTETAILNFFAQVRRDNFGQVTLEFTFGILAIVLLVVGMIKVFAWSGQDLIARRIVHESVLLDPRMADGSAGPLNQVRPIFFTEVEMGAAVNSNIFGEEIP